MVRYDLLNIDRCTGMSGIPRLLCEFSSIENVVKWWNLIVFTAN